MSHSKIQQGRASETFSELPHAWLKRELVMIITMREGDAARWNTEEVLRLAKSFSVGALGFSAAGITAFYPTEIPNHPRSSTLNDRDIVGEMTTAIHRAGMRAIGRFDPSLASSEIFRQHPDWFARDRAGSAISLHGHYVTCPNGAYYKDFILKVVRELVSRYPLDGLWANAAQFSPWHTSRCHCENCRNAFYFEFNEELPAEDWGNQIWRRYNEWRFERIADWCRLVHDVVHKERPSCAWLPLSQAIESWDHTRRGGWDPDHTEPHVDGLVFEAQRRHTNPWWPGMQARYQHSLNRNKGAGITVSYFYPWWRFYHAPNAENQMWIAQIVANGSLPWLHLTGYFSEHFDRRGLQSLQSLFATLAAHPSAYRETHSAAEIAILYSRRTLDNFGGASPEERYLDNFRGAYNALLESRMPFDLISDRKLVAASLSKYRAIILPNLVCLSDSAQQTIVDYIAAGGHVVATGGTGSCNEWGEVRSENLLLRAAGAKFTGEVLTGLKAAYGRLTKPDHPLFVDIEDTDVVPVAGDVYQTQAIVDETDEPLRLIPPVETSPGSGISVPEFNAAASVSKTSLMYWGKSGAGSVAFFPWDIDRAGFQYGHRDLFLLLRNAAKLAADWSDLVTVESAGLIDVSVMDGKQNRILHLVNFSSPSPFNSRTRRAIEQLMPIYDLKCSLRLPSQRTVKRVRQVIGETDLRFTIAADRVEFHLPQLNSFETIEIEFDQTTETRK